MSTFRLIISLLLAAEFVGAFDLKECSRPLGMESGRIPATKISASSSFDQESTGPQHARIRTETGSGAWCPLNQINSTSSEWLQIEFPVDTVVSAIETQGRFDNGRGMEYPTAYLLEYWRPSLGRWARYRDRHGNEIIEGNSDTRSAVLRVLDGGVVAKTIRILPVSDVTRTVCLRVEIYGCGYRGPIKSYSMLDGTFADGLDLRDASYDGTTRVGRFLHGGIGKLYDGVTGEDNFEKHPQKWIGWRRDGHGASVVITVEFVSRRNISAVALHTSNFNRYGAAVFEKAILSFRPTATSRFSPRIIEFDYVADKNFETARWVRIPVPDRLAVEMRIELFFASEAEWLLVSELKIESSKIPFNMLYSDPLDEEIQIEQRVNSNSLTYFAVGDDSDDYSRWISLGVIAALLIGFASLSVLLYILCCCKRQNEKLATEIFSKPGVQLLIETGTVKKMKPPSYSSQVGTMERSLFQAPSMHSSCDSSSEYAEPDCGSPSQPLLEPKSHTIHYASSDLSSSWYNTGTATMCSPLSSYSKYVSYGDEKMCSSLVEIDRNKLQRVEKLGHGEFGTVDLCRLENRLVAVKTAGEGTRDEDFRREITVMSRLRHQNIVEVIGVCSSDGGPLTCIIEFMQNGDLCQYLRQQSTLSSELLVSIATQVAAGMSYLESRNFVHRDLAARNCLVDSDGTVKIGDFGMARALYSGDYYRIQGKFRLPIRWMAWECLLHGRFTSKSDVWAFGVTLFEIFNGCRQQPFCALTDDEVVDNLQNMAQFGRLKNYLTQPEVCSAAMYNQLMVTCWHKDESQRPTFATIHRHLQALLCLQMPPNQDFI